MFKVLPDHAGLPINLDIHPITGQPFENILHLRDAKMRAMLSYPDRGARTVFTTHREVVENPKSIIDQVSIETGLEPGKILNIPEGHFGYKWKNRNIRLSREQLLISDLDRNFILQSIDLDLEYKAGFEYSK